MSLSGWSASNYISAIAGSFPTAPPFTVACWYNPSSAPPGATLVSIYKDASNFFSLESISGNFRFRSRAAAVNSSAQGGTVTTGAWTHVVGRAGSTTDRELYVNGASAATNVTSSAPTTPTIFNIGALNGSTLATGSLAEIGVWNVSLTADEIASLAAGADPLSIRPSALISLIRGDNGGTVDLVATVATVTGTLTQDADHPAVFRSRRRQRIVPSAITSVATSVTLSAASYAFTGKALTGATGRQATLSASSYAFTGQALSAKTGRKQILSPASFAYTGQSLTAQYGRKAVLSAASFSFTGSSLSAKTGRLTTLTKAAYAFSGNALTTNYGRSVTLTGAAYAYTGASLTNLLSRKATLSPASLAFTGQSLVANYGRKVVLTGASFAFNGQVLGVVTGRKAVVSAAAFAYTGQSLLAKTGRKVTLNAASLAFTGQSLTVVYTPISGVYTVTLSPAAFAYAGQGLSTKAGRKSALSPGSLAFSGQSLTAAYAPGTTATNYAVTLSAATFGFTSQSLTAESSAAFLQPLVGGDDAWPLSDRKERKWKPAYPHLREEIQGTLDRLRGRIKAPPAEAPEAIKAAAVVSKYLDEPIDWDALLRTRSHLRRLETALIAYQAWAQAQEDDDLLLLLAA